MKRVYGAIITCRNGSSRLYGKPLQNLDIEMGMTVIDYMVSWMRTVPCYDHIVFAIAEGVDNQVYIEVAEKLGVSYFFGIEDDVLARTIDGAEQFGFTDVTRFTPESPYTCFDVVEEAWSEHVRGNYDASFLDNVPNGSNFEIIKVEALKASHKLGNEWHRTMGPGLFIREHKEQFDIRYIPVNDELRRPEIRLTIDYPEDLVLCRAVYKEFKDKAPRIPVSEIIAFLDLRKDLTGLVDSYVDEGLETMYL